MTGHEMPAYGWWSLVAINSAIFILFAFEYAAGGHLFPLDMLPEPLQAALRLTPFPYMLYFPVQVYLGRIEPSALLPGLAIQGAWVLVMYGVARWVWARGVRHYSAVGG